MVLYRDYDISLEKTNVLTITIRKNGNTWRTILFDNIDKNYKCLLKIFDNALGYNIVFFDNIGNVGINISYVVDDITFFENEFICEKINDNDISKEEIKQLKIIINDNDKELNQLKIIINNNNQEITQLRNELEQLKTLVNNIRNDNQLVALPGIDSNIMVNTNTELLDFVNELRPSFVVIRSQGFMLRGHEKKSHFYNPFYCNNINKMKNVKKIILNYEDYFKNSDDTYKQILLDSHNYVQLEAYENNVFRNGRHIHIQSVNFLELIYGEFVTGSMRNTEHIYMNKSFPNIDTLIITEFNNDVFKNFNKNNLIIDVKGFRYDGNNSQQCEYKTHITYIIPTTHFPNLHTLIFKNKFHDLRNSIPRELYQYYQSKNINVLFST